MVEIDINAILVGLIKSHKDAELTCAYKNNNTKTETSRNNSEEAHLGQWSIRSPENNNTKWIQNANKTGTTRHPPQEYSGGGHQEFQVSLPKCPCRYSTGFPQSQWDRLLPQAEIKINLLCQSNATTNVLAYAHMSGPFDYNKLSLSLMGMSVQVHKSIQTRYMSIP